MLSIFPSGDLSYGCCARDFFSGLLSRQVGERKTEHSPSCSSPHSVICSLTFDRIQDGHDDWDKTAFVNLPYKDPSQNKIMLKADWKIPFVGEERGGGGLLFFSKTYWLTTKLLTQNVQWKKSVNKRDSKWMNNTTDWICARKEVTGDWYGGKRWPNYAIMLLYRYKKHFWNWCITFNQKNQTIYTHLSLQIRSGGQQQQRKAILDKTQNLLCIDEGRVHHSDSHHPLPPCKCISTMFARRSYKYWIFSDTFWAQGESTHKSGISPGAGHKWWCFY